MVSVSSRRIVCSERYFGSALIFHMEPRNTSVFFFRRTAVITSLRVQLHNSIALHILYCVQPMPWYFMCLYCYSFFFLFLVQPLQLIISSCNSKEFHVVLSYILDFCICCYKSAIGCLLLNVQNCCTISYKHGIDKPVTLDTHNNKLIKYILQNTSSLCHTIWASIPSQSSMPSLNVFL
jgi:hypothetical protein